MLAPLGLARPLMGFVRCPDLAGWFSAEIWRCCGMFGSLLGYVQLLFFCVSRLTRYVDINSFSLMGLSCSMRMLALLRAMISTQNSSGVTYVLLSTMMPLI